MSRKWYVPGSVYLLKAKNGLYKIGSSDNVAQRVRNLCLSSPTELILIHSIEWDNKYFLELALHQRFEFERHHGEWFSLDEEQVEWIKSLNRDNIKLTPSTYPRIKITRIGRASSF